MSNDGQIPQNSSGWSWRITNYAAHAETDKRLSWVRCSVEGMASTTVHLTSEDGQTELAAETGSRPEYGPFFCELGPVGAGRYALTVDELDASVDIWLDGSASATVTLAPAGAFPEKPPYLLLGQLMIHAPNFLALTRYVAKFGAVVTFDPQEAAKAEHVILIGATHLVSQEIEQQLRRAGVRVERAQGDIAAQLDRAVEAGTPFLTP